MEFENLVALINAVSESELTGLKYEENGVKIHLTKKREALQADAGESYVPAGRKISVAAADQVSGQSDTPGNREGNTIEGNIIESPLVGTFYTAASEDAEPFVSVGDTVKKGQVMAIVEAMKLMNEIESDYDGVVKEIFIQNGGPVEYGQPLFLIG